MAVDKNFVVKHGLEVNGDLILANALTNRVGIATTVPNYTLHVNGGIGATDLKVLGIATIPQLVLTGTVRAANSIGLPEQYLKSTGSGVEWEDFPVGRTSGTFTASPGQTTFSFTYSVGLVDIFINGVKLTPSEFTATDAVSIVLTNPCFGGEVVDIHAYSVRGLGVGATGITGLTIQDEGIIIGNPQGVTSINFVGVGLTASATGAAVTVSLADQLTNQWNTTSVGINTLKNVGIGTTNPRFSLEVGPVGYADTALWVNGNARITGILTVGTSSIIINGSTDTLTVPNLVVTNSTTGVTASGVAITIRDGGGDLGSASIIDFGDNISVNLASGIATITGSAGSSSQWVSTTSGIHTLSNVGIGTTNATNTLTVKGNTSLETLNVSGVSTLGTSNISGDLTFTGNNDIYLRDNGVINFGDGNDLQIFHNGSVSVIRDGGTGGLLIDSDNEVKIAKNGTGNDNLAVFTPDGSVELYYDNSKKFETLGTGVTITGTTFTNQLNVSGISTLGNTIVGGATTQLVVNGDARITGVLTVGSSSITLDGTSDTIRVGSGITIDGNTGRVDATDFYASGLQVGVLTATTIIYQGATLYNVWQQTGVGINTLSNVGIGTTNPTSSLTVKGNTSLETLNVSGVSTFTGNIAISGSATINSLIIQQSGLNGSGNIAIGDINTLGSSVGSNYNIAIGQEALDNVKSGDYNIAIGYQAAQNNNISDSNYGSNVAIGYQAFKNVRASSNNVAIGYQALLGSSGSYDTIQTVAIGANAGYNVQDTRFGSFFGHQAGYSQTSADYNTFLGYNSGYSVTTGSNNVIIGSYSGNQNGLDIRTSSNNVVLSDGSGNIRFYANSSGNIGLGTINPIGRLQVGSATTNTNEVIITNAGDVGIGTTNPEHFDGFGILTLDGKDYQYDGNTLSGGGNIILKSKGNKTLDIYSYTDNISGLGTATNIDLHYGLYIQQPSGTSVVSLTKSGNVGVGATNPTRSITVSKNTETQISGIELRVVSSITDGNNDGIFFTQTGIGTIPLGSIRCEYKTNGKPDFGIYTRDDNVGGIGTESQKLIIKNNGFIGIGTTNPTSALTVKGTTFTNQLNVSGVSTTNTLNVGVGASIINTNSYGVGIGTTADTSATVIGGSPDKLTVLGRIRSWGPYSSESGTLNGFSVGADRDTIKGLFLYDDGTTPGGIVEKGVKITAINENLTLSAGIGNTYTDIVVNNNGVGIGTTNPTSKLTVRDGDISVGVSTAHGVILTSPNGTQYRLIVSNDGTLSTTAV